MHASASLNCKNLTVIVAQFIMEKWLSPTIPTYDAQLAPLTKPTFFILSSDYIKKKTQNIFLVEL